MIDNNANSMTLYVVKWITEIFLEIALPLCCFLVERLGFLILE